MNDNTGNNSNNSDQHQNEFCFVCRRSKEAAGKMIHLPNGVHVCSDCMQKMMDAASQIDFRTIAEDPMFREAMKEAQNMDFSMFGPMQDAQQALHAEDAGKADGGEDGKPGPAGEDGREDRAESSEEDRPEGGDEGGGQDKDGDNGRRPNISFFNLGDLFGYGGPPRGAQPVKKKKEERIPPVFSIDNIPAPHRIKEELDKYVIGQEHAKKVISVAAYNHYKRVRTGTMDEIEIEKSNILLIGPTGCGKTYLVRTLARLLDVPLAIADATSLTEAGYIGDDIESVVSKLLAAADNDVEKTEKGIIFVDEIDKIARKKEVHSRDVSGESVQQGMLKLLEGAEVEVPVGAGSKNAMVPMTTINTRNILFICGGAFPDLENIIKQRLMKKTSIGFQAELKDRFGKDPDILAQVTNEDLRNFGMIPEFLGRLPITCTMQGLTEDMMVKILKEPKNAILKQYQKLLALDEVKLEFEDDALRAIAHRAMEKDTGARALRSIIEDFMLDIMYEIPKDDNIGTVTITKAYVEGNGGPQISIRSDIDLKSGTAGYIESAKEPETQAAGEGLQDPLQ